MRVAAVNRCEHCRPVGRRKFCPSADPERRSSGKTARTGGWKVARVRGKACRAQPAVSYAGVVASLGLDTGAHGVYPDGRGRRRSPQSITSVVLMAEDENRAHEQDRAATHPAGAALHSAGPGPLLGHRSAQRSLPRAGRPARAPACPVRSGPRRGGSPSSALQVSTPTVTAA